MIIQHNMQSINANNYLQRLNAQKKKSMEKLSSGYKINKAGDNAAGLSISEKMRGQIRGLERAVKNAEEGISFVQVADGAMQEIANILHRMRELSVQSLNDTNTDDDRSQIQKEIEQLRREIDGLNRRTEFNSQKVFDNYKGTYYSYNGNHVWEPYQIHTIDSSNNLLSITYRAKAGGEEQEIEIELESGQYTTEELFEAIDNMLEEAVDPSISLEIRYNTDKTCALEMKDGYKLEQVSGGLSYLFSGGYGGTETAFLVGTTIFYPGYPLAIVAGQNDTLSFDIENYDDTVEHIDITIPEGAYTRKEMIDLLNEHLKGTGMTASEYGDYSIQVGGVGGMISGLKGNMFQIDDSDSITVSVFYDNTKYGTAKEVPATMKGGTVLCESNENYNKYYIGPNNNKLYIKVGSSNDTDSYTEITLDQGSFTVSQMRDQLQNKMSSLGVKVENYSELYLTPNGKELTFSGLQISSTIEGNGSFLDFDIIRSTAYNTLFVDRSYEETGIEPEQLERDMDYSYNLYMYGLAEFMPEDAPYQITEENNSFQLHIKEAIPDYSEKTGLKLTESEVTITLSEKEYNNVNEIITEINKQIENTPGVAGKIKAESYSDNIVSNAIRLTRTNRDIYGISVSENGSNLGYETLFVGEVVSSTPSAESSPTADEPKLLLPADILNNVTKEDILNDQIKIDSSNNSLVVSVNGLQKIVNFDKKTYTRAELAEEITKQLKGTSSEQLKYFYNYASGSGPSTNSYSGIGTEVSYTIECNESGNGIKQDGSTFEEDRTPAKYTMPMNLDATTEITSANNTFELKVNGKDVLVILEEGSYSRQELADALNTNAALQGKVNVALSGYCLEFTTVDIGTAATISFGNTDSLTNSSFLQSICTKKTVAQLTTPSLESQIEVTDTENTFKFKYNGKEVSVTLTKGNYDRKGFVEELNKQLKAGNIDITAELYGTQLRLTNNIAGNATLEVIPNDSGSLSEAIFGNRKGASIQISQKPLDSINITQGNNEFKIYASGPDGSMRSYTAVLEPGTYDKQQLANKLNEKFAGVANVSISTDGYLTLTTVYKGSGAYIRASSSESSSGTIKAIFGSTITVAPDVTASFTEEGALELTGSSMSTAETAKSYQIRAYYVDRSLLEPDKTRKEPLKAESSRTVTYYSMRSRNPLSNRITITEDNKDLEFYYETPGDRKYVKFSLPLGVYTREELQNVLQKKIDERLGSGELGVFVGAEGITFQALKCGPGSNNLSVSSEDNYYITTSPSSTSILYKNKMMGGFYDYIIKGNIARQESLTPSLTQGGIKLSDTYIIGRRDIKNTTTHISQGETDVLRMDITFIDKDTKEEKVYELNMTLEDGKYSCQELIDHIQSKLDEAVLAVGLPAHSVLVDVGLFNSGVANANDENAIQFYLNPEVEWQEGEYRVDSLAGNSLPALFYSTTGDPIPAYLIGTKNISSGVNITSSNNIFSLKVDGVTYTYEIPEGNYSESDFIDKMNEVLNAKDKNGNSAMIKATSNNGYLKISYKGQGLHDLSNVQGSSRSSIFYKDTMIEQHSSLRLQIGANSGQEMELQRTSVSSFRLGVDTISVENRIEAKKALKHIDKAMQYVSGERAIYGAYQNRLEHIIDINNNASENLQEAESRIRDTDIADEMVQYAKYNILNQAGISMLANANSQSEDIVLLLSQ